MTDPTLAPFRVHMGAEGVVISGSKKIVNADGSSFVFTKLTGWDELPALATDSRKRSGNHGMTAGESYQAERNLVLEGYVIVPGDDRAQLRDAVDNLFAAIPLKDELFVVHENGLTRHLYVRQGGQPTGDRIGRKEGAFRIAKFSIQLIALDPIRLSGDGTGFTEHYSTEPGGPDSVTVGIGNGLVPPHQLTVAGPCSRPQITIGTRPERLIYDVDVPPGMDLVINLDTKTARINHVPVDGLMQGQWLKPERRSNDWNFSADTYGPEAQLFVDTYKSSL